jgi:hypothetical protein
MISLVIVKMISGKSLWIWSNLISAVVLQNLSVDGVAEVVVHRDSDRVRHADEQVNKPWRKIMKKTLNIKLTF